MKVNKKSALGLGALIAGSVVVLAGCAGGDSGTADRGDAGDAAAR